MLHRKAVTVVAITVLLVSASCNSETTLPTAPTTTATPPPTPPTPPPPPPVPTGFAGAGTYNFVRTTDFILYPGTSDSSFVLAADGTFMLRYPTWEYKGKYSESGGLITFDFDWNSTKAGATAIFHGDDMTVTYGDYMAMSDFQGGVYRLVR